LTAATVFGEMDRDLGNRRMSPVGSYSLPSFSLAFTARINAFMVVDVLVQ
jgi:hypothetical protein